MAYWERGANKGTLGCIFFLNPFWAANQHNALVMAPQLCWLVDSPMLTYKTVLFICSLCDCEGKQVDNQENQLIWDLCYPVSFHWVICQEPNVLPEGCFPFISLTIYLLNCSNLHNFLHHLTFDSGVLLHHPTWSCTCGPQPSHWGMIFQFATCRSWYPLISNILTRQFVVARNAVNRLKAWHSYATGFLQVTAFAQMRGINTSLEVYLYKRISKIFSTFETVWFTYYRLPRLLNVTTFAILSL